MNFDRLARTADLVCFLKVGLVEEAGKADGLGSLPVPRSRIELLRVLHASDDELGAYYDGLNYLTRLIPKRFQRKVVIAADNEVMLDTYLRLLGRAILRYIRLKQRKERSTQT